MTDTDSKMMRAQQNLDGRAQVELDETAPKKVVRDSDAESGRAREAAKAGDVTDTNEQMDAIFQENKRFEEPASDAEDNMLADAATGGQSSLVRKDRSLLGN